jgi:hypothetical protein
MKRDSRPESRDWRLAEVALKHDFGILRRAERLQGNQVRRFSACSGQESARVTHDFATNTWVLLWHPHAARARPGFELVQHTQAGRARRRRVRKRQSSSGQPRGCSLLRAVLRLLVGSLAQHSGWWSGEALAFVTAMSVRRQRLRFMCRVLETKPCRTRPIRRGDSILRCSTHAASKLVGGGRSASARKAQQSSQVREPTAPPFRPHAANTSGSIAPI